MHPTYLHSIKCGVLCEHKTMELFLVVESVEGSYRTNCQINLVTALQEMSLLLFWHFTNATAYHLGQYTPSSPSTSKELHGTTDIFISASRFIAVIICF